MPIRGSPNAARHPRPQPGRDESERLVRFLAMTDKRSFLNFLDALWRHRPFETALFENYGTKFLTPAALEEKFREYAANELGTSLQQADGG